ncbi:uncharacterized protein MONOS_11016 [Monocercomonoides exilis]|uniref:uncharacterized protein n=1 Tax=Monocercomonoides exilis TaxID=2049356 RepID=UPI00355A82A1|nr:hypothetical protein MONOS_11016 [Monocercomonoides exilis]|eukprot:MONOS_11016.1-p1 / transcript=MONOS_11016.1 / gene=MONOS_11016 / organism=Monocercomonoides_exilis_PA203 / gene_product=unspecified product / transcript_product=unspecified product / location=Mono_scaffold00528:32725-33514(+) / protein_length=203 / sequence_SO=supercontig / SO=protein_coding / is_pseudo=false
MVGIGLVLNIIDLCAGIFVFACGLCWFIVNFSHFYFGSLIHSLFVCLFGLILILYVMFRPGIVLDNFGLLDNWLGYGCFILYCGVICWSGANIPVYIFGSLVVVLGFVYIVFHFIKKIEKPGPICGSKSQPSGNATQSTSSASKTAATPTTQGDPNTKSTEPMVQAVPVVQEETAIDTIPQSSPHSQPPIQIETAPENQPSFV